MAHPGFGHLWQQAEMSDVEIVISVAEGTVSAGDETTEAQNSTRTILQQFPGHSLILSLSPYFVAQALRWATQPQGSSQPGSATATPGSTTQAKRQVHITLPDASYEPAAMAVLAGLYQVKPLAELLADLTLQQQVQAAVLADMWQLPAASAAAVAALQKVLDNPQTSLTTSYSNYQEFASAVLEQLLGLAAVPDSLLPVLELALLAKYGDLEAVWNPEWTCSAFASSQESLLALPLYAMELLLASDKLKVASEDTVLFTAQSYVDNLAAAGVDTQQAVDALAPLVRCPHLSQFWLSASVLSGDASRLLLSTMQPQLKQLLLMNLARSRNADLGRRSATFEDIQHWIPATPAGWLLPQRHVRDAVHKGLLFWSLDVAAIRQAAHESACQQTVTKLRSANSCALGGVIWGMEVVCSWDDSKQGSTVGVYVHAKSLPAGSICVCSYRLGILDSAGFDTSGVTNQFSGSHTAPRGQPDFFGLGAMAGGFDEVAWAAKGLATSGDIILFLVVKDVCV